MQDSDTDTTLSDSASLSDGEERREAQTAWQAQAGAWIAAAPAPTGGNIGDAVTLGLRQTTWATEQVRRTHLVLLDSLDRDQTVYPLPTALRLKLPRVYKNVERLDVVQLKFLNSVYTFSAARTNTGFTWCNLTGNATQFSIPEGTYSFSELQNQFSAAGFTLQIDTVTGKVTLSRTDNSVFIVSWARDAPASSGQTRWGLGWYLGFPKADLVGQSSYTGVTWPRLYDDYAFLQLNLTEKMNEIDHTSPEDVGTWADSTGQVQHYFGKVLLNTFGCWSQTMVEAPKTFRPPLGRLERINVNWLDCTGQPIGGGAIGCDWHMALRIIELTEEPTAGASLQLGGSGGAVGSGGLPGVQ